TSGGLSAIAFPLRTCADCAAMRGSFIISPSSASLRRFLTLLRSGLKRPSARLSRRCTKTGSCCSWTTARRMRRRSPCCRSSRRALVQEVGGFRSAYDFAQDYDLYLRIIARTQEIHHVPRVLYHWRRTAASTADNIRRKPETLDAGRRALADSIAQRGERGHVTVDWGTHLYRVRRELAVEERVAIIIPTRDQIDLLVRCIR